MKKYWKIINGKEYGPYTIEEIQNYTDSDTLVWEMGTPYWKKASEFEWYKPIVLEIDDKRIFIGFGLIFLVLIILYIISSTQ